MTTSVNYYRIASDCYSSNTCHVGGTLCSCRADTDGVAFGSNTGVADIYIVIPCGEKGTGAKAQRNIVTATCVDVERKSTTGCVLAAGCVVIKRAHTGGCVDVAVRVAPKRRRTRGCIEVTLCIALERQVADRRIVDGLCVVIERTKADRRVVEAGCKAEKRIITLSSVVIRIAAAWCGKNG